MKTFFFVQSQIQSYVLFFGITFMMIDSLEAKAYFYLMLVNGVIEGVHRRQENACPFQGNIK